MCAFSECRESRVASQGPGSRCEPGFLDQYEVLRALGHGEFGQVHLARHRLTGAEVAVKVLQKGKQNLQILSEVEVMMALEHPNVVQLFQVVESYRNVYIV
ncbi:sperm motility kinase 2B-like protein, partial [Leptotrombidium deliense]